ncbi:MAG: hypothetical protein DMD65_09720 [Gemmatimonadetes bacterium]|nr:MAG: hypothetical protein DMD65_09720 [Gemmatimonadota bacterium]
MRPPPYGGTGKCHATSKSITPRGGSGRDSSTRIIVPYAVRRSSFPAVVNRSIVIPPMKPLPVKSNTAPPAKWSGGWFRV